MITTENPTTPTIYPNRQQMLALIQARAALSAENRTEQANDRSSPKPEFAMCKFGFLA